LFGWLRLTLNCRTVSGLLVMLHTCASVGAATGVALLWVDELTRSLRYYLCVFTVRSHTCKCSLDHARKSLCSVACIPVLRYGLEACPLTKSDLSAIEFFVNRCFMKLFRTNNTESVKSCRGVFRTGRNLAD